MIHMIQLRFDYKFQNTLIITVTRNLVNDLMMITVHFVSSRELSKVTSF